MVRALRVDTILETCLYVDDLQLAEAFYTDLLGLVLHSRDPDRHLFLRCGERMLLLFLPEKTSSESSPLPLHGSKGPGHIAFAIEHDEISDWKTRLAEHGTAIEQEVTWPNGGHSLYFRDPAGNSVELATADLWM